ncbi:MAG: EAL domain-containing protein [Bacillota bacterium]
MLDKTLPKTAGTRPLPSAVVPLRVLIIEDSDADVELLLMELARGGFDVTHGRALTETDVHHALEDSTWDLIISDYSLPGFDGRRCLQVCQERGLDIPFILMSGTVGEEIAVEAMKAGAHDYIMKDRITRLVPAIQRELREAETRRERRAFLEQIEFIAYHDPVTRLPNQRLFLDEVERAVRDHGSSRDKQLILAMPEISKFREIRTTVSALDYDVLVRSIAARFRHRCPDTLALGRMDEHTFAMLFLVDRGMEYDALATRIMSAFEEPYELDPFFLHLDANLGLAIHGLHATNAGGLLRSATVAASQARDRHKLYALYSQVDDYSSPGNLALLGELRDAIRNGQLLLHYQPIIDLRTNRAASLEALVRWNHPKHGLMQPERFLKLAESSNLITPLTSWVIDEAFTQWRTWDASQLDIDIGINLSVRNIQDRKFVSEITDRVEKLGISPGHFVFEVTESSIMTDSARATEVLGELHEAGFKVAIDDFGTGYSSLAYLQKLPMDDIKVDRNFVTGITENPRDYAIVTAVLGFASGLGKRVVAEGVENAETLGTLRNMGCHYAQGFHISEPLPPEDVARWLMGRQNGH